MLLKTLTLTNIRVFNHAEITFQPGMNLIVGINGVGKSTILDASRILLSQALPKLSQSRSKAHQFQDSDMTINQLSYHSKITFNIAEIECMSSVSHGKISSDTDSDFIPSFERKIVSPMDPEVIAELKNAPKQPLALYFSTRRALPSNTKSPKSPPGIAAAFNHSLNHRELRLMEFSDWWLVQKDLATEGAPNAQRHLDALTQSVTCFLDRCTNVQVQRELETRHNMIGKHVVYLSDYVSPENKSRLALGTDVKSIGSDTQIVHDSNGKTAKKSVTTLTIDKAGVPFDLRQLSDGERGVLAIVLDLARRLSIANPTLDDPLQAQAVVLIDELDLHLHPQWQRSIVSKLTTTFPNCQFIATTHSPIIIGEVPPENIILIRQEGNHTNVIQSGLQGFGFDSSWILRHLMDTDSRNPITQAQIDRIEDALEEGDLDLARQHLDQLKIMLHGSDDEVIRLEASINNLEALADALDTEE
jgi:predicted ATP-binding protein involved in virulence